MAFDSTARDVSDDDDLPDKWMPVIARRSRGSANLPEIGPETSGGDAQAPTVRSRVNGDLFDLPQERERFEVLDNWEGVITAVEGASPLPMSWRFRFLVPDTVYYARMDPTPLTQTTREIYDLLQLCHARSEPLYVKQDTLVINEHGVRVTALAPSDGKIQRFLGRISQLIPKERTDRRAPGKLLPNDVSAALLIELGDFAAVFGADLEETPGKGWSNILKTSLAFRNAVAPQAFKVAHHGSENADCPALWSAMNDPVAILAPFKLGSIRLPSPIDVRRILKETKKAYSTSSFKTRAVKRLSRVDNILIGHRIRRQDLYPKNGHVRLRFEVDNTLKADLFASAVHLSQVH